MSQFFPLDSCLRWIFSFSMFKASVDLTQVEMHIQSMVKDKYQIRHLLIPQDLLY